MNHGMVKLCEILPGIGFPNDSENKHDIRAPKPTAPKVVGDATRTPVNLQAALITAKASWIHKPLPVENKPIGELERLRCENSKLKLTNKNVVSENSTLRRRVERLEKLLKSRTPKPQAKSEEQIQPTQSNKQRLFEKLTQLSSLSK